MVLMKYSIRNFSDFLRKFLRLSFLIYYLVSIFYRSCFLESHKIFDNFNLGLFFDYFADSFYLFDTLFFFNYNGIHPSDIIPFESSSSKINKALIEIDQSKVEERGILFRIVNSVLKYIDFSFQIFLVIPFDAILYLAGYQKYYWFRIIKLARVLYYNEYWNGFNEYLGRVKYFKNVGIQRMFYLSLIFAIACHIAACIYYLLGISLMRNGSTNTWIYVAELVSIDNAGNVVLLRPILYNYLKALYWAYQTVATVAFGDLPAKSIQETWFCSLVFYFSAFLSYCAIANLVRVIMSMDSARTKNLIKISRFNKYASTRKLPPELSKRVQSYFEYQWHLLKGVDENQIFSELPSNISQQITQSVVRDLLVEVKPLEDLNKGLLNAISENIESYIYSPSDIVVDLDSNVNGLYIIATGKVQIQHQNSNLTHMLNPRESFGVAALNKSYKSLDQYKSRAFSEVLFLKGTIYRHLCKLYMNPIELEELNARMATLDRKVQSHRRTSMVLLSSSSVSFSQSDKSDGFSMKGLSEFERAKKKMFEPESRFRLVWDSIILLGILFYLTSLPMMLAATVRQHFYRHFLVLIMFNFSMDFIFLIDFMLQATLFQYVEDGIIIRRMAKIFTHFLSQDDLYFKVLAILPIDLFCFLFIDHRLITTLRFLKLIHLRNAPYYLNNFEEFLREFFNLSLSFEMSRFISLYFMLFQLCNWAGCIWQLAADVSIKIFHEPTSWRKTDMTSTFFSVDYSALSGTVSYFRSIYWAITVMSSVGTADILATNPVETITVILVMYFGCLSFNALLGGIASLMTNFYKEQREFTQKVEKIKKLVSYKSLPIELEAKILRYYEYIWSRFGGVNEEEVLNSLPRTLRIAVTNVVMGPLIQNIPFFSCCSEPMEKLIVSMFQRRVFLDGDPLMIAGESGKEMFIIEKGKVIVTSADKKIVFAELSEGNYIGESSLLESSRRVASVYAKGYVDTYCLSSNDFLKAVEKFPSEYRTIINSITQTLKEKQKKNLSLKKMLTENSLQQDNSDEISGIQMVKRESYISVKIKSFIQEQSKVVHPDSNRKLLWDILFYFVLLYYLIITPLRIAVNINPLVFVIDYFCDCLNYLDIYFYSSTFAMFSSGHLLDSIEEIRNNYKSERMWIDILAAFPYDLLALAFLGFDSKFVLIIRAYLRLPKIIKTTLIGNYHRQIRKGLKILNVKSIIVQFCELTFSIILICHWVACVFYLFAKYAHPANCTPQPGAGYGTACQFRGTWVEQQIETLKLPINAGDEWMRLLIAFYWAVATLTCETMADVWVMNQNSVLYAFFVMFFGLSINGAIIGSIMSIVSDSNEEDTVIYRKIEQLRQYLSTRDIPKALINRAIAILQYRTTSEGILNLNQDEIIAELPYSIKISIDKHLKTVPFLRTCQFFDFCSDEVLRGISSRLKLQLFAKGDRIINFGELGSEMYFLEMGTVDVMSSDEGTVYSTLESGAFFGETALFFRQPRTATIMASSPYCICLKLTKVDLDYELRTSNYDSEEILKSFSQLRSMNQKRNEAVSRNLKLASDPKSKLFRLIQPEQSTEKASRLLKLRKRLTPNSKFRFIWDTMGLIILLYYTFSIPFYIAFYFGSYINVYIKFIAIDFFVDFYWIFDILLKSLVFSYYADSVTHRLITDGDFIFENYRKNGYFYLDIIASFPLEFIALDPSINKMALFICRSIHLLRFPQIANYSRLFEDHLKAYFDINLGRASSLLFKSMFAYFILNHWMSCIYFMIHRYSERHYSWTYVIADGLSTFDPLTGQHDICNTYISTCYARSFYFVASTMGGIGYGDITPYTGQEITWQMVVAIIGAYIAATVLGFFSNFLEDRDASSDASFKEKIAQIDHYINFRRLDDKLKDLIITQYSYLWKKYKSIHGLKIDLFDQLSLSCQVDISFLLNKDAINKFSVLKMTDIHIRRRIAQRLIPQLALEKSYIYKAGDTGKLIYFVASGKVNLTLSHDRLTLDSIGIASLRLLSQKEERHGQIYQEGDHFGEFCLISKSGLRAETTQSVCATEIYAISKEDLWSVFLFMSFEDRRKFIHYLMSYVGEKCYIPYPLHSYDYDKANWDDRIKNLYKLSYQIMKELIDDLEQNVYAHKGMGGDDEEEIHENIKRMIREESQRSLLSQKDLNYLFEELNSPFSNSFRFSGNFSPLTSTRKIKQQQSFQSVDSMDDFGSPDKGDEISSPSKVVNLGQLRSQNDFLSPGRLSQIRKASIMNKSKPFRSPSFSFPEKERPRRHSFDIRLNAPSEFKSESPIPTFDNIETETTSEETPMLQRRSSISDFEILKNAIEIEERLLGHRKFTDQKYFDF